MPSGRTSQGVGAVTNSLAAGWTALQTRPAPPAARKCGIDFNAQRHNKSGSRLSCKVATSLAMGWASTCAQNGLTMRRVPAALDHGMCASTGMSQPAVHTTHLAPQRRVPMVLFLGIPTNQPSNPSAAGCCAAGKPTLRRSVEFQWFLIALSVRPLRCCAMRAHCARDQGSGGHVNRAPRAQGVP